MKRPKVARRVFSFYKKFDQYLYGFEWLQHYGRVLNDLGKLEFPIIPIFLRESILLWLPVPFAIEILKKVIISKIYLFVKKTKKILKNHTTGASSRFLLRKPDRIGVLSDDCFFGMSNGIVTLRWKYSVNSWNRPVCRCLIISVVIMAVSVVSWCLPSILVGFVWKKKYYVCVVKNSWKSNF